MTDREFELLLSKIDEVVAESRETKKKLFVGNGSPSLVSRIQTLEENAGLSLRAKAAVGVGGAGGLAALVQAVLQLLS